MPLELNHDEVVFKSNSEAIVIAYNPFQTLCSGDSFYAHLFFPNLFENYVKVQKNFSEESIFVHSHNEKKLCLVNPYRQIFEDLSDKEIEEKNEIEKNNEGLEINNPKYKLPIMPKHHYETDLSLLETNLTHLRENLERIQIKSISFSLLDSKPSQYSKIQKFYNDLNSEDVSDLIRKVFKGSDAYIKIHYDYHMRFPKMNGLKD